MLCWQWQGIWAERSALLSLATFRKMQEMTFRKDCLQAVYFQQCLLSLYSLSKSLADQAEHKKGVTVCIDPYLREIADIKCYMAYAFEWAYAVFYDCKFF